MPGEAHCLLAVGGFSDNLDAVLFVQDRPEALPYQHLIVGDQHADHVADTACAGATDRVTDTRKPPSLVGPTSSSPPSIATRSRLLVEQELSQ